MLLLSLILACGSKTMETESVTTGETSPAAADSTETVKTEPGTVKTTASMSASTTTGKSANTAKNGTGTASTSATVTFVKPAETTTESEEIPMDDHSEETDE